MQRGGRSPGQKINAGCWILVMVNPTVSGVKQLRQTLRIGGGCFDGYFNLPTLILIARLNKKLDLNLSGAVWKLLAKLRATCRQRL